MAPNKKRGQQPPPSPPPVALPIQEEAAADVPQPTPPVDVFYCKVCTFPLEYCEFGSRFSKCKEWLKDERPDLYDRYYSQEALQAKIGTLSLEGQALLEKDTAKKEAKAKAKALAEEKKKEASAVTVKRIQRNKNKYVTSIHGLEAFGVDLKKAAKLFATKFACGSSVTKNPQGQDEIVVQGDVSGDIVEMIEDQIGMLKGIPPDNIVKVEEKKKKGES